jgi:hypothetical protein
MWIVFRIAVALIAFLARCIGPFFRPKASGSYGGQPWYKKVSKSRSGKISSFTIGMPLDAPFVFRLQREESSDRWFKSMGLAHEFQTGDTPFDEAIYIACDHPALHRALKEKAAAREWIVKVLDAGYKRISGDGRVLWIERPASEEPTEEEVARLSALRASLSGMRPALKMHRDPFNARVVAVEALTWSLFAYAAVGLFEYLVEPDVYVGSRALLVPGLGAALALVAGLLALVAYFLRGSSRGSRILIESAILLVLAAPIAGMQLVDDLNRGLDRSEPTVETWNVTDKWATKRRRSSSYHLALVKGGESRQVTVEYGVYSRAKVGHPLRLHIAKGALGYRWYRAMEAKS